MKIVHILPEINKGGTERLVLTLAKIQSDKHKVFILVFNDLNLYPKLTDGLNIIKIDSETNVEYGFFGVKKNNVNDLKNKLNEICPDVIHSHSHWTHLLLVSIPKMETKYVAHFHLYYPQYKASSGDEFKSSISKKIDLRRLNYKFKKYRFKFVTISKDIDEYYKKALSKKLTKNVFLIPNAANLQIFKPPIKSIDFSEPFEFVNVSRLIELKNLEFLFKVMKRVKDIASFKFKLSVYGDGPLKIKYQKIIDNLDLSDEVSLLGNTEDIQYVYQQKHLYLHSALKEPFGLTCLEALACGLPCLSLRAGGIEDIVIDGENGFLLETDINKYAEKVIDVMTDFDSYLNLKRNTTETIKKFDFNEYYHKIDKLYKS